MSALPPTGEQFEIAAGDVPAIVTEVGAGLRDLHLRPTGPTSRPSRSTAGRRAAPAPCSCPGRTAPRAGGGRWNGARPAARAHRARRRQRHPRAAALHLLRRRRALRGRDHPGGAGRTAAGLAGAAGHRRSATPWRPTGSPSPTPCTTSARPPCRSASAPTPTSARATPPPTTARCTSPPRRPCRSSAACPPARPGRSRGTTTSATAAASPAASSTTPSAAACPPPGDDLVRHRLLGPGRAASSCGPSPTSAGCRSSPRTTTRAAAGPSRSSR